MVNQVWSCPESLVASAVPAGTGTAIIMPVGPERSDLSTRHCATA